MHCSIHELVFEQGAPTIRKGKKLDDASGYSGKKHCRRPLEAASPMKTSGRRSFSFSSQKQESGVSYGLSPSSNFSQASTYTNSSTNTDRNKIYTDNSFSTSAREVAGAFISCFVPQCGKSARAAARKDSMIQADDMSSASNTQRSHTLVSNQGKLKNDRHMRKAGSHYQLVNTYNRASNASRLSTVNSRSQSKLRYSGSTHAQEEPTKFTIEDIYKATGNFAVENIIGQGGFGIVYKGKLKNGSQIAVKRAKKSKYDMHLSVEFKNEIQTLSKVEHLNLVRLLGYLDQDNERIIVVEYVSNGTLREHLDGSRGDGLGVAERLDIAVDVAHAIAYLHMYTDRPIIHRDIKAANILLTESLRAKVADFGFARLATDDPEATHVSTQIKGTAGYLDPEYLRTYQLTDKSDVYSFGVLLVELVTGRRPIERHLDDLKERVTTRWAMQRYKEGNAVMAMDPKLRRSSASIMAVERALGLALECLEPSRRSRPSMKKVAEVLWGIRRDFREMQRSCSTGTSNKALKDDDCPELESGN